MKRVTKKLTEVALSHAGKSFQTAANDEERDSRLKRTTTAHKRSKSHMPKRPLSLKDHLINDYGR